MAQGLGLGKAGGWSGRRLDCAPSHHSLTSSETGHATDRLGRCAGRSALTATGCSTVNRFALPKGETISTNAGNTVYSLGRATQVFEKNQDKVHEAAIAAMTDLKVQPQGINQTVENGVESIEGKTSDGKPVKITIEPLREQSKVTAQVGYLGDKSYSLALIDRIGVHLGVQNAARNDSEEIKQTSATTEESGQDGSQASTKKPEMSAWKRFLHRDNVPNELIFRQTADESNYKDTPGGL